MPRSLGLDKFLSSKCEHCENENTMRTLVITLSMTAAVLFGGLLTWNADAQTWRRAVGLKAASQNYTPIEKAACYGWGRNCPPGRTWVCRYGNCWCRWC
jgi:hypothetical protein